MIEIQKAKVSDVQEITELVNYVHDHMEHKEWYVVDDMDYYAHFLRPDKGYSYKAVDTDTNKICGIFMAIIPETKEQNLGYDISLSEEACKKVAVMDTAAVHPDYRGKNLQYLLMQAAEKDLQDAGYKYLTVTIHPDNLFSLNNVCKQGYHVILTKEKYGGHLRHVLLKKI